MNAPLPAQQASPIDFDSLVGKFVKLRDKIKEIEDKHKDELKPYKDMRERLEGMLLEHLNTVGADKVGTKHGTVSRSTKPSASIADMNAFWNWVVVTGNFDMVDKKANAPAVRDYINEQAELAKTDPSIVPAPPPGVNFATITKPSVRRAGEKPE